MMRSRFDMFAGVPPKVKRLILASSFGLVANGYLIVIISAYLPETGVGPEIVGLILAATGIMVVAGGIPLGILSDRRGRKWILIAGTAAFPPAMVVFALTTNPLYLALAAILSGFAESANLAAWNAMIADQTTVENRDAAFSLSFVTTWISFGLGSMFPFFFPTIQTLFAANSYTIHKAFLLFFSMLSSFTSISLWALLRDHAEVSHIKRSLMSRTSLHLLLKFTGIISLLGFGGGLIIPLIPTWLFLKFGVQDVYSGPLLALSNVTIGLAAVVSPKISGRYGPVRTVLMTTSLSGLFMFSLAFLPNATLAGGFYVLRAALMNMSAPIVDSYFMGVVSPQERGFASAVISTVWRLPDSASTIIGGMILQAGIYDVPFFLATGFYVAFAVLFYVSFKNVKPRG